MRMATTGTRFSPVQRRLSTNFKGTGLKLQTGVKTDLMPNFDFDAYNHDQAPDDAEDLGTDGAEVETVVVNNSIADNSSSAVNNTDEEVDKW